MKRTFVIIFFFVTALSIAQEKKEAAQKEVDVKKPSEAQKDDVPLPKIDLPEFVITGNEKINLDLQPKTEEDEDRLFTPEKPSPGIRNLAADGGLSPKQTKLFVTTPSALNGKIFSSIGFFTTPQFNGWFGQHDNANSYVINGYYSSTEGHVKNADGWKGGFGAKGKYVMPDSSNFLPYAQLSGDMTYGRESYHAYGSEIAPARVRDLSALGVSLGLGSRYALPYRSMTGLDYTGTIGLSTFDATDFGKSTESDFYINGGATTRLFGTLFRGLVEYRTTGYTMNIPSIHSGQWFAIKADGLTSVFTSLQLSYAVQQWIYRGNIGVTSGRFYPNVELRYFMTENALLYAGGVPSVERTTLSSLIEQNRYINFNSFVRHSDNKINAYVGMEFTPLDELTAKAKYSYKQVNNYPTFLDTGGAKVWEVTYLSGVYSSIFDMSMTYRLNGKQNVTAFVTARSVRQKDSSGVMPYVPKISFGSVYHQFFDLGLHVEVLAEYVASRYTNFSNSNSTAGYVYTSVKADMELMEHFRGYCEIQNLINQHYYIWNGYRERELYVSLGISYQW